MALKYHQETVSTEHVVKKQEEENKNDSVSGLDNWVAMVQS